MRKSIVLLVLCLLAAAAGCFARPQDRALPPTSERDKPEAVGRRETIFYLPDRDWQFIIPVRFAIPWEEGIARSTLSHMVEGRLPTELLNAGLSPLLPAGTEILGLTVRDGLARVDFSRAFLDYEPERERKLLGALIFTLTEFPTVNSVEIMVEGVTLSRLPGGTAADRDFDREYGLNQETTYSVGNQAKKDLATLYFLYNTGQQDFFVPVARPLSPSEDRVKAVAQELLLGPARDSGLHSAIPPGLRLLRSQLEGSNLRLYLAGELASTPDGQFSPDRLRDQVALTLTGLAGIAEIAILVNGKVPEFPDGDSFPLSFNRPGVWNKVATRH